MKSMNKWCVDNDDDGFPVYHYIGGEDVHYLDDFYDTEQEAEERAKALNEGDITGSYTQVDENGHYRFSITSDPKGLLFGHVI